LTYLGHALYWYLNFLEGVKEMKRWALLWSGILILSVSLAPGWAKEKTKVVTAGDFFPEFAFPMTLTSAEIEYLGLPTKFLGLMKGDTFSLKDVKADLIIVEYMNKYCFSCQLQAPVLNQVYEMVGKDPQLRGRVRFLSIAAGNNQTEANSFKAEKGVPFPIIPDSKFLAYEAIGDPGATPFTLMVRKTDSGLLIARAKVGLTREAERFMKEINESLRADWDVLVKQQKDLSVQESKARKLLLRYNEDELLKKAKESMLGPKWRVLKVVKLNLPDDEDIYVGEIQTGNQKSYLFAKLASRAPTCDICHATHFLFTFDEKGMIVSFLPLQVTKLDNLSWDSKEIEKMKGRLVGRSILQPTDFDPQIDSISSATMTAALIVDSVNKAKSLYDGLKNKGYIK
jgi:thiol-disulfide isomerase/thioredoxin